MNVPLKVFCKSGSDNIQVENGVECCDENSVVDNSLVYAIFSKLGKDIWFIIFRKVGMKNTKNLYISCKWWHDYITAQGYFDFLITHKLMKLFHMFINNTTFACSKNDQNKNNQMCMYVAAQSIENHFAKYMIDKIRDHESGFQFMKLNYRPDPFPQLNYDCIYCERCDRYHDSITEKMTQKTGQVHLCKKCNLVTCKWMVYLNHFEDEAIFLTHQQTLYKKNYLIDKSTEPAGYCDECTQLIKCSCDNVISNSLSLFCASKQCYKQNCNVWKCSKCVKSFFTPCKCCGLSMCSNCLKAIDFSFTKIEKGYPTPIGSEVCNWCIENKIKQCGKCNTRAVTNLLWKCKGCTKYFHKECFDVKTKCSLCKAGQKMPKEHRRKCGENLCESCYENIASHKCKTCLVPFQQGDCVLCERNISSHNKEECAKLRNNYCSTCSGN
jgi:hypothetical protein